MPDLQLTQGGLSDMLHSRRGEPIVDVQLYLHVVKIISPPQGQQQQQQRNDDSNENEDENAATDAEEAGLDQDENADDEEEGDLILDGDMILDEAHAYRLHVRDGTNSYDEVYLHERVFNTSAAELTDNVLIKVSSYFIVEMEKIQVFVLNASILKNPKVRHGVAFRCMGSMRVHDMGREKIDLSKQLIWRMDNPNGNFSDFKIVLNTGQQQRQEKVYYVHRIILAFGLFGVQSGYFASLFGIGDDGGDGTKSSGMRQFQETIEANNEVCITLDSWQAEGIPLLLDYLYSGKLSGDPDNEHGIIVHNSASLLFLGDYFQVPKLVDKVMDQIKTSVRDLPSLQPHFICIMVSQHIDGMKSLHKRAVFLVVEGILLSLGSGHDDYVEIIDTLITVMDAPFLSLVLQYLRQLTSFHNPLMKKCFQGYELYTETHYIACTVVQKFIMSKRLQEGNKGVESSAVGLSQDDFYILTNKENMPNISPDTAQFLLDIDATLTYCGTGDCCDSAMGASSSLQKRCIHALELQSTNDRKIKRRLRNLYLKILSVDEHDPFNVGHYELCRQRGESDRRFPADDFYYTNSSGRWEEERLSCHDEESDSEEESNIDAKSDKTIEPAIFHLVYSRDYWSPPWCLHKRTADNELLALSISGVPKVRYNVLPPTVGWRNPKTGEPFFLLYCSKEESADDGSNCFPLDPALITE